MVLSTRRLIMGASLVLKVRTTDEADTAHVVSRLPTTRKPWYIFSPDFFKSLDSLYAMQARDTSYFESMPSTYAADVFITPCLSPFLSKDARQGKNSVALINVAINFDHEYFCFEIYFSKLFFSKCVS